MIEAPPASQVSVASMYFDITGTGLFPPVCFVCGASVPQWSTPVPRTPPRSGRRSGGVRLAVHESAEPPWHDQAD